VNDKSALLVIDVQKGVVLHAWQKESVVERINLAIESARKAGVPIIWVQHSEEEMPIGSEFWQIIPELVPQRQDARIDKIHGSSFKETDLAEILAQENVRHLYITGAQSENCVNATTIDALERGLKVSLISDAHTTDDETVVGKINEKFLESGACGHAIEVKTLAETLPLT
jgi:nicotinamidase-related amidase